MIIQEKRIHQIIVIHIEGDIALTGTAELRAYIKPLIEDNTVTDLLMNFENVTTIDSSGIGMIVQIYKLLSEKQKRLIITNLNDRCYDVFSLTRLNKILTLIKTEVEGIELLK
jgi:anti-anti-sigma factor